MCGVGGWTLFESTRLKAQSEKGAIFKPQISLRPKVEGSLLVTTRRKHRCQRLSCNHHRLSLTRIYSSAAVAEAATPAFHAFTSMPSFSHTSLPLLAQNSGVFPSSAFSFLCCSLSAVLG